MLMFSLPMQQITEMKFLREDFLPFVYEECEIVMPGLQWPFYYLGTPGSFFSPHLEDQDLPSANFHIMGDPKKW
jgi:hypothetical protein